jgi:small subunit ribosomal protein S15Ae
MRLDRNAREIRVDKANLIEKIKFNKENHVAEYEKAVANLLPSRQFGFIVMTTTYGIMDHESARKKHTGGKLLGFFY